MATLCLDLQSGGLYTPPGRILGRRRPTSAKSGASKLGEKRPMRFGGTCGQGGSVSIGDDASLVALGVLNVALFSKCFRRESLLSVFSALLTFSERVLLSTFPISVMSGFNDKAPIATSRFTVNLEAILLLDISVIL